MPSTLECSWEAEAPIPTPDALSSAPDVPSSALRSLSSAPDALSSAPDALSWINLQFMKSPLFCVFRHSGHPSFHVPLAPVDLAAAYVTWKAVEVEEAVGRLKTRVLFKE